MRKVIFLFMISLFSCEKDKKHEFPRVLISAKDTVVDVNTKYMLHMFSDTEDRILAANFDKDTIVGEKKDFKQYNKYYVDFEDIDTILPRYNFKIIIDTSYTIEAKGFEYKKIKLPNKNFWIEDGKLLNGGFPTEEESRRSYSEVNNYYNNQFKQWKDYVRCYPLLIYNSDNKPAYIWYYKYIQEAKDIDGKWKPIEYFKNSPSCLVITNLFKLKQKKYELIPIIKYNGNFKTRLRVKIKIDRQIYYSNEIEGYINRTQFDRSTLKQELKLWSRHWDDEFYDKCLSKYIFLND